MSAVTKNKFLFGGAVTILIISIVVFVFIPVSSGEVTRQEIVFGKWKNTPIAYQQDSYFLRQVQQYSEQMQSQGQEVNKFSYYQIMQAAFNSAAIRLSVLDELKAAGYKIPQSQVNKQLIQYYLDQNGKYSTKLYNDTPEATRASRRSIMTEELTAQRYLEDVFGAQTGTFGLKNSSKEIELVKKMANTERSFDYVSYSIDAYPETEVVAYGTAHSELFSKHDLSLITIDAENTAKKVAARLAKKDISFEDAVTTYSTRSGTDTTGKMTNSLRNDVNALFTDAKDLQTVLALKAGETSGIVKTGKTFAIVRCNAAVVSPDFTNKDVIAEVRAYMNEKERGKLEDYFVNQAKGFVDAVKASNFDTAAKAAGLTKKTTAAFVINYGNISVFPPVPVDTSVELSPAVKNETFFTKAFSLAPKAVSDPIILGNNVVVLQLAEEKAADPQIAEMLPMFFNYYASSWSQKTLSQAILKSDKLEDNFMATYLKNFLD
jgi:hypothetical protein